MADAVRKLDRRNNRSGGCVRKIMNWAAIALTIFSIAPSGTSSAQSITNNPGAQPAIVHVDTTPGHVINSFDPDSALGSSIDVLSRRRHRQGLHSAHHPGIFVGGMGADLLSQQQRTPHGRLALDRKWNLERPGPQERILHRQHGTQRARPLHPFLCASASRILDQRRPARHGSESQLLEEQSLPDQQIHRAKTTPCIRSGSSSI